MRAQSWSSVYWELQSIQVEPPYTSIVDYNIKKRMQMRNIKVWICLLMSFFTYPLTPPGRPKGPLWYLHDWRLWSTCLEIEVQISPDHDPLSLSWSRKRCPNMSREKLLPGLNPGHCQLFEIHTFYIPIVRLHLRFLLSGAYHHHIVWWSNLRQISGKGTPK